MHGGCSTGPKTPEGLERSTKANWKHGRYSAKALAGRKRWSWVGRFISVLKNYDKLNRLLMIIAAQVDANETSGLKAKCRTALKLWRQFLKMLETEPADGRSKNECMTEPADRIITRMLDAGIAGDSAQTIRAKLALWRLLTVEETRSFQEPLTVRHP
jgi:hypothetical protein